MICFNLFASGKFLVCNFLRFLFLLDWFYNFHGIYFLFSNFKMCQALKYELINYFSFARTNPPQITVFLYTWNSETVVIHYDWNSEFRISLFNSLLIEQINLIGELYKFRPFPPNLCILCLILLLKRLKVKINFMILN